MGQSARVDRFLVTAAQMQAIEHSVFAAGMPVAALMEKVGGLLFDRLRARFPRRDYPTVGILVGPGHNGGDGLVVARELLLAGYEVRVWMPSERAKPLTADHARYLRWLGATRASSYEELQSCHWLIDGLFGFGLTRSLEGIWAETVDWANRSGLPMVSIDLPSGLETDTGETLGTAVRATATYCLGLWKRGLLQDRALEAIGQAELIDFGLPLPAISDVLGEPPQLERITGKWVRDRLPPQRWGTALHPPNPDTHKYTHGHLLLVCGSARYSGAAILTALGARPSGVGMLTAVVPQSIQLLVRQWLPEALVVPCAETEAGCMGELPELDLGRYTAIAVGPGMDADIDEFVRGLCDRTRELPLVVDADGLNAIARLGVSSLKGRLASTVLTPHLGEFRRLFPQIESADRIRAAQEAAKQSGTTVLLKGARTAIGNPDGRAWLNPDSTPALARGGSGDVLTGLIGGLLAQGIAPEAAAGIGTWWHARAAIALAERDGPSGVDPLHLAQNLGVFLQQQVTNTAS
ncbi:bifunctional ADP-dependent NAD(P)H-hydrate dehydratase/NAD(P)H-hydrate epimerase [Synechococcus sp. PCC 7336]|uniref:bifunctional ADP-dependent NAD(P)H-hydrate dehydratase/NAD(P)H-hydrate epimerase n=1 Tax=Synechococcus sp. PCC 7336 TaxID=195250 RepID=UPI000344DB73|nr:bifunctional ADP-dependent NAD(P)H-hydrate dehydratase/NAD(P)H-hydrate epimerase [Synechococcus sp. PCC 7336]